MSHFSFLQTEWPDVYEAAAKAEALANPDARGACFYARRALELALHWAFKHDPALSLPYQDNLSALMHEPSFRKLAGEAVFNKARVIVRFGNEAVHGRRPVRQFDAHSSVRELFHVAYWFARTYARGTRPEPGLAFDVSRLPSRSGASAQTAEQLQGLEARLRERDEKLSELLGAKAALDEELRRLREEVARARDANEKTPDTHDYSEDQTRKLIIDLLLKEVGWTIDRDRDCEIPVSGMPNKQGVGYVDYVLWGDDGRPLALIEAKRTQRDPIEGQQQAKLYADCLERQFGQRPVIFYSNGYEHWLWDDLRYPPRPVQGFYRKDELELLVQRRTTRRPLAGLEINSDIVERFYQKRAIRRIAESFEQDAMRKALVVMATGAGKTRTVIALVDLLMRANRVKRVLFLADRVALVKQAVGAFKTHLPDSSPVNLVTEKGTEGRVFVSTYPTMMGLIEETGNDGQRRFGPGHFDLVIIDEAHRSVFRKYRAIFDYFDSLLVGLTATPKEEVDRNTYSLFDLETGVPTDEYSLPEAVKDGYLVPMQAVHVPLKFQREGIDYESLSEEEKERWDELEWDEEDGPPDRVESAALNEWLFNQDTVDKVLAHLMTRGQKVEGGDRLGKTIVFAKNNEHAKFIVDRFNAHYPAWRGEFARVITYKTEYAETLIDDFTKKDKAPHIAVSVDMLDTGIDVPEVVNLAFFKPVRSKTKFWQMIGRGTRLCRDLFGPGEDKQFFFAFDYCGNFEFFRQNPALIDGAVGASLSERLFQRRVELVGELDEKLKTQEPPPARDPSQPRPDPSTDWDVRGAVVDLLREQVASMNVDNFVVRPKRQLVEAYAKPQAWGVLTPEQRHELTEQLAGLPTQVKPEPEESKRFDLLVLRLQLALLRSEPSFAALQQQVIDIAQALEEQATVPSIRAQLELIQELRTDEWWQDVTAPMLEVMRLRLRLLVKLIEKKKRKTLFTNFEDEMGPESVVDLLELSGDGFERFREKARAYLRANEDHLAVRKLRRNEPLTQLDVSELERMLLEAGIGNQETLQKAVEEAKGLGLFVRSLVGLERDAAKRALATFLEGTTLSGNQIDFVNLVIDHLTEHGAMEPRALYESPFTDLAPEGPDALFADAKVTELIAVLRRVRETAQAVA